MFLATVRTRRKEPYYQAPPTEDAVDSTGYNGQLTRAGYTGLRTTVPPRSRGDILDICRFVTVI